MDNKKINDWWHNMVLFCTSLPLACSRWVRSTIKLYHALSTHTKQRTAVFKSLRHQEIRIFIRKILGTPRTEPGSTGWEAQTLPLCLGSVLCRPPIQKWSLGKQLETRGNNLINTNLNLILTLTKFGLTIPRRSLRIFDTDAHLIKLLWRVNL